MLRPELRGGANGVAIPQSKQGFVARHQGLGRAELQSRHQGAEHRQVVAIRQVALRYNLRLHQVGQNRQGVDQIIDGRKRQSMTVDQPGQGAAQLSKDGIRQHEIQRPEAPGSDKPARDTGRVSEAREQQVGVEHVAQAGHCQRPARLAATATSISASPSASGTSA